MGTPAPEKSTPSAAPTSAPTPPRPAGARPAARKGGALDATPFGRWGQPIPPKAKRARLFAFIGLALLIVGLVLWIIPVSNNQSATVLGHSAAELGANPPLAVFSTSLPYSITWSASSTVTVTVLTCSDINCLSTTGTVTSGSGTSGSLTWHGARGTYFEISLSSSASTISVTTSVGEPVAGGLAGIALFAIGLILFLVGWRRWGRALKEPMVPAGALAAGGSSTRLPATVAPGTMARPGTGVTARAAPTPPRYKPGQRTYLTFAVIGIILVGVGAGLALSWYPYVVHSTDAATFLSQGDATLTTDQGTTYVQLQSSYYHAGETVVIQDTVKTATYNASSGTTQLSFKSIADNPLLSSILAPVATSLFGTLQGQVSWIGSNSPVVLTFTVVRVQLPGGPYGSGTYLTLDAAADASYRALSQGLSGPQAVAILPQYVQGYPALEYDGLFYFLIGLGVAVFAVGRFWGTKLEAWLIRESKDPKNLPVLFMGFLGVLGGSFVPFYPWPIVLLVAGAVMLVAWKFPQLSLLILVLFITPAVAYQSGALGLIFLFATIPILFATLLDWRFGAGVFLTLLLAPYGLSFVGPVFMALIFSLYLGLAIAVAGGLLVSLFVTLGNFPVFGYLTGPGGNGTVSLVSGHAAPLLPTLPLTSLFANEIGTSYASLLSPNLSQLAGQGAGIGALPIPLAEIGVWCLAIWLVMALVKDRTTQTTQNVLRYSTASGSIIAAGTFGGLLAFGYLSWGAIAVVLFVPAMLTSVVGALILRDAFEQYFTSRLGGTNVGTRVAEMKGLTKVTFDMVGGLHDVKSDIKESMIVPLLRRDVTTRFKLEPPKGILLFGPPGCGKTMLMKALATELGVEMISIKCSDVMSKWYGESEGKIAELLRTARERAPCILFMDEIDAIAKRRDLYSADDVTPRLLSILLSEMDGIDKSAGVIVVGSTNKPDLMDPAIMRPGRLDKIIYVPPPDFQERTEILHVHLVGRPVKGDIDLAEVAKKTERFSGADLANLVREATTVAVRRQMTSNVRAAINMDDFRAVVPRMKPSISLRMIADYETMKLDYERKMHQSQRSERKIVVRWDDVGGLEDIKGAIREYVELPLTRPELMESYRIKTGRGIMLFGPPGCGKTHLMRAAANELNVPMQIVNGPELVSALAGQSEAAIREVLYRARENAPSIIFFDEIDALASKDSMRTPEVSRAVSQFLTEMDGLRPKDKVIIIATTNRPQTLDPALLRPGRFDKIFYVPPPDLAARRDIFKIHLRGVPVDGEIDYDQLAEKSAGYSGADIASLVDEAKMIALRTQLGQDLASDRKGGVVVAVVGIRMSDMLEALSKTKSSITAETLTWAQEFIRTYGTRG